ncbi:MAG: ApaG domain [Verrucomicrobiales bacterium]|nr:ApaG domain [Verrucomicrobiales bacterium]
MGSSKVIIPCLAGLRVQVDQLLYMPALQAPPDRPHPFAYFITIENRSDRPVTLLGRKWVVRQEAGGTLVVEGSGVVGRTPTIEVGETFSYNSYHTVGANAEVSGAFLFSDENGCLFTARIPDYHLEVPLWGV